MKIETRADALKLLGLKDGAGQDEIKSAYKQMAMRCHPDQGGTDGLFQLVNEAHEMLTKPDRDASGTGHAKNQGNAREQAKAEPKKEARSFQSIIYDPKFCMSYSSFLAAMRGNPQKVTLDGYSVIVSLFDIQCAYIKTKADVTVHVKTYDTWFQYVRDNPTIKISQDIQVVNDDPHSTRFGTNLNILLPKDARPKYYRMYAELKGFNEGPYAEGKFVNGQMERPKLHHAIYGPLLLTFNFKVSFKNKK